MTTVPKIRIYRWASDRHHRFVLDGMADHAARLAGSNVRKLAGGQTAMRTILGLLPICLLLLGCASAGEPANLGGQLEQFLHRQDVNIAIAYRNLGTGAFYFRNEDDAFHAASTMKLPVMMALFQTIDAGERKLSEPIPVRNQFQSLVDASPFTLDPKDDGDPDLYQAVGSTRTLEELIRRMIVRSSNLATNILIERLGASRATDLLRSLGAYQMKVLRGVEDEKSFKAGLNNTATAKDLEILLTALAKGETFSPASNAKMIEILKEQEFNEKIPAFLPKGIPIAHKTGDITGFHHDAAIVFPPGEPPYVLVVLTGGFQDEKKANQIIAEISRMVWQRHGERADAIGGNHGPRRSSETNH
ncbi:MAG TPA: serine hydrolase [Thermoanaerobaculia bacterium]|nr:serine hydrolase [Thermoanaerobaculia bacterium]